MKPAPTLAAINAAESRVVQSRGNVRQSVERTRSALRAVIARPSTLVLVTVASGISAFLLTSRRRPSVKSVTKPEESKLRASVRGLLRTFVSMYGVRVLTLVLQLGAAARRKNGSPVNANRPSPSPTGD